MPILDTSRIRGSAFRPLIKIAFWLFVINFLLLLWLGGQHVEQPFISIGQVSTILYFTYFIFIVPIIGLIENTLIDLNKKYPKIPLIFFNLILGYENNISDTLHFWCEDIEDINFFICDEKNY